MMIDFTKALPNHSEKYVGENDLFLEIYEDEADSLTTKRPPLLFVHGAYTGSWMWSKYIPHFVREGWKCYAMNMRSHYKSRVLDMTKVTYKDYMDDIKEITTQCAEPPIIIGFSMGGILCQKLAETVTFAGLVLIDTSISKEVYEIAPYTESFSSISEIVEPAPAREEYFSIDESADDIAFQKKYLTMESSKARNAIFPFTANGGISINGGLISCPSLVIKAVNSDADDKRGRATAEQIKAEYIGLCNKTHTGLLIGQRYMETVDRIIEWLKRF